MIQALFSAEKESDCFLPSWDLYFSGIEWGLRVEETFGSGLCSIFVFLYIILNFTVLILYSHSYLVIETFHGEAGGRMEKGMGKVRKETARKYSERRNR